MSGKAAWVLRASVIFTFWVWVVLIANMVTGHFSWSFRAIHIGLAIVAMAFAVATWKITSNARRFKRAVDRERAPERMKTSELVSGLARVHLRKASTRLAERSGTAAPGAPPAETPGS